MTKPEKQDGTMELDVGQIDLLDLPLPPRSKPAVEAEEPRGSKGPPPLPPVPSAPPAEEEPPVPSLAIPNSSSPSQPHPPAAISARKLAFGPPPKQKSPVVQLMLGMGGATILCVLAFVGWKMTHKAQPVAPAPVASTATAPAATQAFTMAPIEFTSPVTSGSAPPEQTAAPSAHAAPTSTTTATTATTKPSSSARTAPTSSGKPPKTDELIKVEN